MTRGAGAREITNSILNVDVVVWREAKRSAIISIIAPTENRKYTGCGGTHYHI